jgi:hypothetical protein
MFCKAGYAQHCPATLMTRALAARSRAPGSPYGGAISSSLPRTITPDHHLPCAHMSCIRFLCLSVVSSSIIARVPTRPTAVQSFC